MGWRSIIISTPAILKVHQFRLAITQKETNYVPFEDIAIIVLNHAEISLTHPVLANCAEHGISLFSLGSNHIPNGVFLPFLNHSRTTQLFRLQTQLGKAKIKQTWADIVRSKIENQSVCLELANKEGVERLHSYKNRVRSGDTGRLEAQAAAYYFVQLFGKKFTRSENIIINKALNYGYAIMRGAVARGIIAHGLYPVLGLFHSSEQNAFNLADDLLEPFRPLVDLFVFFNIQNDTEDLNTSHKIALVSILNIDVQMPKGKMSVLSAIEQMIESLVRIYHGNNEQIIEVPKLLGVEQHSLEA